MEFDWVVVLLFCDDLFVHLLLEQYKFFWNLYVFLRASKIDVVGHRGGFVELKTLAYFVPHCCGTLLFCLTF